jgi:3-oxoadipate enol-lactonase
MSAISDPIAELIGHTFHPGGQAGQMALLLIHPLGADRTFWDECIAIWHPQIACIACDLRSAGTSPRSGEPVAIARHVEDLEAVRAELGVETVVPVGCAIGSMMAAAYAATHPERTSALVLSNAALRTSEKARAMLAERADRIRATGMAAVLPNAVDNAFRGQPRDERYTRYFERFAKQDAAAYATSVLGVVNADISALLPAVQCPALVVAGGQDVLLPLAE